jgi:hypothetical protein
MATYIRLDVKDFGRHEYATEKYGHWETDHDYEYDGAYIIDKARSGYFSGVVSEDLKIGDRVYVVIVSYDTGNSFGRERDVHVIIDMFADGETAGALVDLLTDDARDKPDPVFDGTGFVEFNGRKYATNEWKGYFEHFNRAFIEIVTIKGRDI